MRLILGDDSIEDCAVRLSEDSLLLDGGWGSSEFSVLVVVLMLLWLAADGRM